MPEKHVLIIINYTSNWKSIQNLTLKYQNFQERNDFEDTSKNVRYICNSEIRLTTCTTQMSMSYVMVKKTHVTFIKLCGR